MEKVTTINHRLAKDVKVYSTSDYSKFTPSKENRLLNVAHLNKLTRAMAEKNLFCVNPIVIDSKGRIISGHHRFEAGKRNNLPILYMIYDGLTTEDIAEMHRLSKNWTLYDFLYHHVQKGNKNYIALNDFIEKYEFSITDSLLLMGQYQSEKFRKGMFKMPDIENISKIADHVLEIAEFYNRKKHTQRHIIMAVAYLMSFPQYDRQYMLSKLTSQNGSFEKCRDTQKYVEIFEKIYNFHTRTDRKLFVASRYTEITSAQKRALKETV